MARRAADVLVICCCRAAGIGPSRREEGGGRRERVVEVGGEARKEPGELVKCCRRYGERQMLKMMLAMVGR